MTRSAAAAAAAASRARVVIGPCDAAASEDGRAAGLEPAITRVWSAIRAVPGGRRSKGDCADLQDFCRTLASRVQTVPVHDRDQSRAPADVTRDLSRGVSHLHGKSVTTLTVQLRGGERERDRHDGMTPIVEHGGAHRCEPGVTEPSCSA